MEQMRLMRCYRSLFIRSIFILCIFEYILSILMRSDVMKRFDLKKRENVIIAATVMENGLINILWKYRNLTGKKKINKKSEENDK